MKTKEKISIDEFDGKRFQIRLVEPKADKKAILTHYLHNIHNGVSKHYKKDALKVLKEYVTNNEENLIIIPQPLTKKAV
jgi:DNA (cytosine-5)-methyltransferase 1